MVALALVTTLLALLGSYAFYTVWFLLSPNSFPGPDTPGSWLPTPLEW